MKITYAPNPLRTTIELDEHEKLILWHKIRHEEMVEMLFNVHYELVYKKEPADMERVKKEVDPDYYLNEIDGSKTPLDKRCDELLEHYLEELQSSHCGDCTCFAMSCSKCHAEEKIGIDTIRGLGKHSAHKIQCAFDTGRDPNNADMWLPERSLDEAIRYLHQYDPKPTSGSRWDKVGGFFSHVPRWKEEAKQAHAWLTNYRDQHFPKETS